MGFQSKTEEISSKNRFECSSKTQGCLSCLRDFPSNQHHLKAQSAEKWPLSFKTRHSPQRLPLSVLNGPVKTKVATATAAQTWPV